MSGVDTHTDLVQERMVVERIREGSVGVEVVKTEMRGKEI